MNIRRSWIKLALLLSVAAMIGFATPFSMAYIVARSDILVNTFNAPSFPPEARQMEVRVHKTVRNIGTESIGPQGFRFALQNPETGENLTLTTEESGYAAAALSLDDKILNQTYTYYLSEIDDGRANVTYSNAVYTIQLTLDVNEDNQIIAAASMNGVPVQQIVAEFENIYNAGTLPPLTGDETPILLYAVLMLISCVGMVILLPNRNGWLSKR